MLNKPQSYTQRAICGIRRENRGLSHFAYPTNEVKSKKLKGKKKIAATSRVLGEVELL